MALGPNHIGRPDRPSDVSGRRAASRARRRSSEIYLRQDPDVQISFQAGRSARRSQRAVARRRTWKKRILAGIAAVAVVGAAYGAYTFFSLTRMMKSTQLREEGLLRELTPVKKSQKDPVHILIMGVDSRAQDSVSRADTIMLLRAEPETGTVSLLSIPRDLRVEVPGHGKTKINHSRAYGGAALAVHTVREFTGLPINHYVEIDFEGFKDLVDALGGVTVDVPHEVYDLKAANHVEAAARIPAGVQKLDGAHALTFVRSRAYPKGDFQRIENQQAFLKALARQLLQPSNVVRWRSIVESVARNVSSDMTPLQMLSLAEALKGIDPSAVRTYTVPGKPQTIDGVSYVLLDAAAWQQVRAQFIGEAPSGDVSAPVARDPSSVKVVVRNGAGIEGVASDAARRLRMAGYDVREVGNMGSFAYDETLVVYRDDQSIADDAISVLGIGRAVRSRGMYSFKGDLLVVVGRDWGAPSKPSWRNVIK